jgi:hypothetical protein
MSSTVLNILGDVADGETFPGTPYALAPGGTVGYLGFSGNTGVTYSLYGDIGSAIFTVGGVTYSASDLDWATATWPVDFNGVLPIDVTATAMITTPEPNSSVLLVTGIGLLGLVLAMRKRGPGDQQQAS